MIEVTTSSRRLIEFDKDSEHIESNFKIKQKKIGKIGGKLAKYRKKSEIIVQHHGTKNGESKRNEEEENDVQMEEKDYEEVKNVITFHVSKNVDKEWIDTKSLYQTLKLVKKFFNEWVKVDETINVVHKHNKMMEIDENWTHGVRTTGKYQNNNKKIELFVEIITSMQLQKLKQKVINTCEDERVWIKQKNSGLEHVKRIGVLVGVCVPYSSL